MKVGLLAHDSKKKLMQNFCIAYRGILTRHELYATGTTGTLIEEVTNLKIHKFSTGRNRRSETAYFADRAGESGYDYLFKRSFPRV